MDAVGNRLDGATPMRIVVHEDPVGRSETNWIARIALEPFGFVGLWEQE